MWLMVVDKSAHFKGPQVFFLFCFLHMDVPSSKHILICRSNFSNTFPFVTIFYKSCVKRGTKHRAGLDVNNRKKIIRYFNKKIVKV